ncbi:MAG: DNA-directed RNA polymerase subunit alpha [Waddliaceae bacterium]
MSLKYGNFEMPQQIKLERETSSNKYGKFIAEPLEIGYGHTIGNALRRMLLSSIQAPAIIGIKIEGVSHEFMAVDGVIEDMTNIVLNLKGALLRKLPTENVENALEDRILIKNLDVKQEQLDAGGGQHEVKLGDIVQDGIFEVVNPEFVIFTATKPIKVQIDLRVTFGRGYVPSDRHIVLDKVADEILIDGIFTPVRLVNYSVENTRVGQDTDFNRLILEITTDGRITPSEALSFVAQIGQKHFSIFEDLSSLKIDFKKGTEQVEAPDDDLLDQLIRDINEIELSVRSTNCLRGANIETIAELVIIPERKMLEFRNFGKKSLTEIKEKLVQMGLGLGMDLSPYGITQENVRDKVKQIARERKKELEASNG